MDLAQQVERYAHLSLSGSFSAQVGSAVRLLEQNYIGLKKMGVGQDHLHRVQGSLGNMKRKLEILNIANEKARKVRDGIAGSQRGEDEASEERTNERVSQVYINTQIAGSQRGEDERASIVGLYRSITLESNYSWGK